MPFRIREAEIYGKDVLEPHGYYPTVLIKILIIILLQ